MILILCGGFALDIKNIGTMNWKKISILFDFQYLGTFLKSVFQLNYKNSIYLHFKRNIYQTV